MNQSTLEYFLMQLAYTSPMLLVYVAGVIVAFVCMGRSPGPAIMTVIALLVLMLTSLGQIGFQGYMLNRLKVGMTMQTYSTTLTTVGVILTIVRAGAVAALIVAVFIGRGRRPPEDDYRDDRLRDY